MDYLGGGGGGEEYVGTLQNFLRGAGSPAPSPWPPSSSAYVNISQWVSDLLSEHEVMIQTDGQKR